MKILVTGGTGFIGSALLPALKERGHTILVLSRSAEPGKRESVHYARKLADFDERPDAVINLAGASLADRRWTDAYKRELLESRLGVTRSLGEYFQEMGHVPDIWLNASAVGYYGPRGPEALDETSETGTGFAAELCRQWEAAAAVAAGDARLCLMRFGVVLDAGGGAYPQMAQPFKFGVANWIGDGRQYLSWVHRHDVVAAILYMLENQAMAGPVNVTAPETVTSREFCSAMRKVHTTFVRLPMPGFVMRAMVGEMADELLITGQNVKPARLAQHGFSHAYPSIDEALQAIEN